MRVLRPEAQHDRSVVSLFSGAGGMDIGLEMAGWKTLAQVDMDADCINTLRANANKHWRNSQIIEAPIEKVIPRTLRKSLGLKQGELGLIAGGPPCQPFTTTGLRKAINDKRAESAFPAYLGFVAEFKPKALMMENVDGFLSAALCHRPLSKRGNDARPLAWEEQKGSFLHHFLHELAKLGYSTCWGLLEAADHGVAQMRQRTFLIGVRGNAICYLPEPSHGGKGQPSHRNLRQALVHVRDIGAVQPLSERKKQVYSLVPAGGNWRNLPVEVQRRTMGAAYEATGGKSGWWRRLSWDAPAPTILGMPDHSSTGLIHPGPGVRCLSVNEYAAIQSFPGDYVFAGNPRSQYQQIGNAVPPQLAAAVGTRVAAFLDGERFVEPESPVWRKASGNRRIGTHGWLAQTRTGPVAKLIVQVRADHVWSEKRKAG